MKYTFISVIFIYSDSEKIRYEALYKKVLIVKSYRAVFRIKTHTMMLDKRNILIFYTNFAYDFLIFPVIAPQSS